MIDQMMHVDDPLRAIAEEILAERKRQEVAAPWFRTEIVRRAEERGVLPHFDPALGQHLHNGGVYGLASRLLKRKSTIAGLKAPERIYMVRRKVYKPIVICSEDDLRSNSLHLGRGITKDHVRKRVVDKLADLLHETGVKTVGDLPPDAKA